MQVIEQQASLAQQNGLFKSASAWDMSLYLLYPRKGSHKSFYRSLARVSHVDYFVTHSWSCSKWKKALQVCHFFNFDLAMRLCCLTCLLGVLSTIWWAGSLAAVPRTYQSWIPSIALHFPVAVFLLTYCFGHVLSLKSLWFDGVCVNQADLFQKAAVLQAVPAFVANAREILLLWDETYFERLWCIYELAVAVRTCPRAIHFVPTWAPIWISAGALTISVCFTYDQAGMPPVTMSSRTSLFAAWYWYEQQLPVAMPLLAALPASWFCFQKLDGHKKMLDQMASFELLEAKCALETDRVVLHRHVLDLFDEALEAPLSASFDVSDVEEGEAPSSRFKEALQSFRHITSYPTQEEITEEFNAYVRGYLRDRVLLSIGREVNMSLSSCVAMTGSLCLLGVMMTLGCDGHTDCEAHVLRQGYHSVAHYMMTCAAVNCFSVPVVCCLCFPLVLRINHLVGGVVTRKVSRMMLGTLGTALVFFSVIVLQAAGSAATVVIICQPSSAWLCGYANACFLLCLLLRHLFANPHSPQRIRVLP